MIYPPLRGSGNDGLLLDHRRRRVNGRASAHARHRVRGPITPPSAHVRDLIQDRAHPTRGPTRAPAASRTRAPRAATRPLLAVCDRVQVRRAHRVRRPIAPGPHVGDLLVAVGDLVEEDACARAGSRACGRGVPARRLGRRAGAVWGGVTRGRRGADGGVGDGGVAEGLGRPVLGRAEVGHLVQEVAGAGGRARSRLGGRAGGRGRVAAAVTGVGLGWRRSPLVWVWRDQVEHVRVVASRAETEPSIV